MFSVMCMLVYLIIIIDCCPLRVHDLYNKIFEWLTLIWFYVFLLRDLLKGTCLCMVQPLPVPMERAGPLHETNSLLPAYSFFYIRATHWKIDNFFFFGCRTTLQSNDLLNTRPLWHSRIKIINQLVYNFVFKSFSFFPPSLTLWNNYLMHIVSSVWGY